MREFNVLIVDDQKLIRDGLKAMIDWPAYGYHLIGDAENGRAALNLLAETPCDLILTDIRMPDMDGIELIRKLREMKYPTEVIIISGYNDFTYAQTAMQHGVKNYLLKPIAAEKLIEALLLVHADLTEREAQKEREVERTMLRMLAGSRDLNAELSELQKAGVSLRAPYYCVTALHLGELDERLNELFGSDEQDEKSYDIILGFLRRFIACHAAQVSPDFMIVLFLPKSSDPDILRRIVAEMVRYVESYSGVGIQAVIGDIVPDIQTLPAAYATVKSVMEHTIFWGIQGVRVADASLIQQEPRALMVDIQPLLAAVRSMNQEAVYQEIDRLVEEITRGQLPLSVVHVIMAEIVFRLMDIVIEHDGDIYEGLDLTGYYNWLYVVSDVNELANRLREIGIHACVYLSQISRKDGRISIMDIVRYIDANYAENLSIKRISQLFYMSPVYLGRLFTATMGVNLNSYLNRVRVKNAQELLTTTDVKIYNICGRVGYKSLKYFYKIFKEETGMTPHEYRLIHGMK